MDDRFPDPASAIRLARECDVPSILPAAFYQLARTDIDMDRLKRDDVQENRARGRTARWDLMTGEDMVRLMHAQKAMRRPLQQFLARFRVAHESIKWCRTFKRMDDITKKIRTKLEKVNGCPETFGDPLYWLWEFREEKVDMECDDCCLRRWKDVALDEARDDIWNKLPEYFNLENNL